MKKAIFGVSCLLAISTTGCGGCGATKSNGPTSAAGVAQAKAEIQTDDKGHTVEQKNIIERLKRDNQPGSVKHLYVVSAYSGQVIMYSPVAGKVTSSGKRLTPTSIAVGTSGDWRREGFDVDIGGKSRTTGEVIQDDGTYGSSAEYLYWFTPDGRYMQTYISGGTLVYISDQPLSGVKGVTITIESK